MNGTSNTVVWVMTPREPSRLARLAMWYIETACQATGHARCCLLMNYRHARTVPLLGLWTRFVGWAIDASNDKKWVRQ